MVLLVWPEAPARGPRRAETAVGAAVSARACGAGRRLLAASIPSWRPGRAGCPSEKSSRKLVRWAPSARRPRMIGWAARAMTARRRVPAPAGRAGCRPLVSGRSAGYGQAGYGAFHKYQGV